MLWPFSAAPALLPGPVPRPDALRDRLLQVRGVVHRGGAARRGATVGRRAATGAARAARTTARPADVRAAGLALPPVPPTMPTPPSPPPLTCRRSSRPSRLRHRRRRCCPRRRRRRRRRGAAGRARVAAGRSAGGRHRRVAAAGRRAARRGTVRSGSCCCRWCRRSAEPVSLLAVASPEHGEPPSASRSSRRRWSCRRSRRSPPSRSGPRRRRSRCLRSVRRCPRAGSAGARAAGAARRVRLRARGPEVPPVPPLAADPPSVLDVGLLHRSPSSTGVAGAVLVAAGRRRAGRASLEPPPFAGAPEPVLPPAPPPLAFPLALEPLPPDPPLPEDEPLLGVAARGVALSGSIAARGVTTVGVARLWRCRTWHCRPGASPVVAVGVVAAGDAAVGALQRPVGIDVRAVAGLRLAGVVLPGVGVAAVVLAAVDVAAARAAAGGTGAGNASVPPLALAFPVSTLLPVPVDVAPPPPADPCSPRPWSTCRPRRRAAFEDPSTIVVGLPPLAAVAAGGDAAVRRGVAARRHARLGQGRGLRCDLRLYLGDHVRLDVVVAVRVVLVPPAWCCRLVATKRRPARPEPSAGTRRRRLLLRATFACVSRLSPFEHQLTWVSVGVPSAPTGLRRAARRYPGRSNGSKKATDRPRVGVGIRGPRRAGAASLKRPGSTATAPAPPGEGAEPVAPKPARRPGSRRGRGPRPEPARRGRPRTSPPPWRRRLAPADRRRGRRRLGGSVALDDAATAPSPRPTARRAARTAPRRAVDGPAPGPDHGVGPDHGRVRPRPRRSAASTGAEARCRRRTRGACRSRSARPARAARRDQSTGARRCAAGTSASSAGSDMSGPRPAHRRRRLDPGPRRAVQQVALRGRRNAPANWRTEPCWAAIANSSQAGAALRLRDPGADLARVRRGRGRGDEVLLADARVGRAAPGRDA